MERMGISAVGMLWFRNTAQYAEYIAIFEDSTVMPTSYSKWQKRATEMYENILRKGGVVIKVHASPDEFRAWCVSNGKGLNADGRMGFAAFKAAEKIRQTHAGHEDA
ncbi:hypothetical protein [Pseudomonas sp. QTF5]|uniref:hypothetical protein n=1 Tax=Pseudomonas sp. QTF5 TaxID=1435425 RepID=UPI0004B27392|nr:hypothetical protein [Pseudomonas sp. QTF5]